ncbi:hypothetical protein E2C01_046072 [Portunus trituberculatus]|uniref:Uncharacterized protein n=1 Tax=Portunus trituberculatus TaxID=210409 RepID=A0A5B7G3T4_PORTR|nr:hypothetical protein [Portunus trituberculatus]
MWVFSREFLDWRYIFGTRYLKAHPLRNRYPEEGSLFSHTRTVIRIRTRALGDLSGLQTACVSTEPFIVHSDHFPSSPLRQECIIDNRTQEQPHAYYRVYTKVSKFLPWIYEETKKSSYCASYVPKPDTKKIRVHRKTKGKQESGSLSGRNPLHNKNSAN